MRSRIKTAAVVAALAVAGTVGAGRASAAFVNYTVSGTFENGSVLSGSFSIGGIFEGFSRDAMLSLTAPTALTLTFNNSSSLSTTTGVRGVDFKTGAGPGLPLLTLYFKEPLSATAANPLATIQAPLVGSFGTTRISELVLANGSTVRLTSGNLTATPQAAVAPSPTAAAGGTVLLAATTAFGALRRRRTATAG